jgi:hypothetical protein
MPKHFWGDARVCQWGDTLSTQQQPLMDLGILEKCPTFLLEFTQDSLQLEIQAGLSI